MTQLSDAINADEELERLTKDRETFGEGPFYLLRKETGVVEEYSFQNACDLLRSGQYTIIPPDACDVCHGTGEHEGKTCWHCDGELADPSK